MPLKIFKAPVAAGPGVLDVRFDFQERCLQ